VEADGVAALGLDPLDLIRGELRIPHRRDGERDQPLRILRAPVLDVPVVPGLQRGERQLLVFMAQEYFAGHADEGAEVQAGGDAVDVHVADPRVDVIATRAHLRERRRLEAVLVARPADDGVGVHVDHPAAAEGPVVIAAINAGVMLGSRVAEFLRDAALERVRRLDDVVIDAEKNHVFETHFEISHRLVVSRLIIRLATNGALHEPSSITPPSTEKVWPVM